MQNEFLREVLRNRGTLTQYLRGEFPELVEIERHLYVGVRERNRTRPDHLLKNRQRKEFAEVRNVRDLLENTLKRLGDYYLTLPESAPNYLVKSECYAEWQNLISEVSPLVIVSWKFSEDLLREGSADRKKLTAQVTTKFSDLFRYSALPTIDDEQFEKLIQGRLNELHLHLNGSTEAELVWRDALSRPREFSRQLERGKDKNSVLELYEQEDLNLNHEVFLKRLSIARNLRYFLLATASGSKHSHLHPPHKILTGEIKEINWNIRNEFDDVSGITELQREVLFLLLVFSHLKISPSEEFSHALYAYLLIKAQFFRLLVQQQDQWGFDQFQKITENEIREMTEADYAHRFHQLEYSPEGDINVLEGRFAPSIDQYKNIQRIKSIIKGYLKYHRKKQEPQSQDVGADEGGRLVKIPNAHSEFNELLVPDDKYPGKMRLSLIAHFIKKPDKRLTKLHEHNANNWLGWSCRHFELRQEVEQTYQRLNGLKCRYTNLPNYFSGIDAAANELHAPPEVFSPIFRHLRKWQDEQRPEWKLRFTFHAGEDFVHLLSGIRYVYEAVKFLEMTSGDRIGHGTAVGIDPALWKERRGGTIVMTQGARLDDLVFSWKFFASERDNREELISKIEGEIVRLTEEIYGAAIAPELLYEAWELRSIDPIVAFDLKYSKDAYIRKEMEGEIAMVSKAQSEHPRAFTLFKRYHSIDVVSKSEKLIEVGGDEVESMFKKEDYRFLQKCVLDSINGQGMAIEVLPTSNVRISFYNSIDEHHVFSWLGLTDEGDKMKTTVCLGSDDPGIFSTNLRNEYAHIWNALNALERKYAEKATDSLSQLIADSRSFRFRSVEN